MQWQSPRNKDAFDITSLHHAVPLTTSLVSSTFSAEPMGPEQHRHCRSEHNKKIIISWNQRSKFRCISLWDRICETHQNEYAWISLPWVIVVIVILPTESPVFFQEVSMSMYRSMAPSYAPWRPWCHPKPLGFWKAAWKAPAAKALGDSGSNGCHCLWPNKYILVMMRFFTKKTWIAVSCVTSSKDFQGLQKVQKAQIRTPFFVDGIHIASFRPHPPQKKKKQLVNLSTWRGKLKWQDWKRCHLQGIQF